MWVQSTPPGREVRVGPRGEESFHDEGRGLHTGWDEAGGGVRLGARLYGENSRGCWLGVHSSGGWGSFPTGAFLGDWGPLWGEALWLAFCPVRVSLPSCHWCGQRSVLRVGRWGWGREEGKRRHPALTLRFHMDTHR